MIILIEFLMWPSDYFFLQGLIHRSSSPPVETSLNPWWSCIHKVVIILCIALCPSFFSLSFSPELIHLRGRDKPINHASPILFYSIFPLFFFLSMPTIIASQSPLDIQIWVTYGEWQCKRSKNKPMKWGREKKEWENNSFRSHLYPRAGSDGWSHHGHRSLISVQVR